MIVLLIMLVILVVVGVLGAIALCHASAPLTPEERIREDEEQMKWIRNLENRGNKK